MNISLLLQKLFETKFLRARQNGGYLTPEASEIQDFFSVDNHVFSDGRSTKHGRRRGRHFPSENAGVLYVNFM
jgi:hypothetical protein